jgi:subtilisin family serine protease
MITAFSLTMPTFAQEGEITAEPVTVDSIFHAPKAESIETIERLQSSAASANELVSVIVKLEAASLASYAGGVEGLPATSPTVTGEGELDVNSADSQLYLEYLAEQTETFQAAAKSAIPASVVTHRYDLILGGVAMVVPVGQLDELAGLPGVQAVYEDKLLQIDTERSPAFIGAPTTWSKLGGQGSAGEGVIVGVLDTGIWPEHPSYSDPDPLGKPYAAPPAPPVGTRACEFTGGANPGAPFTCNNKLIGADRFMVTYDALNALLPGEFTTARDDDGHGTHTSSTAAGNRGVHASIFGVDRGVISGIAPRAHVMMYKVCGEVGCYTTDSAAAVQEAIRDGVDVINFSISGGTNPYSDIVSLAFLDAYNAGVFVAASAGNSGPGADTTAHREPWVTTVAASTTDRHFLSTVHLTADNGDTLDLVGASVTDGILTPTPVVFPPAGLELCGSTDGPSPFAPGTFSGEIVVCRRGGSARVTKSRNVGEAGGAGMLLYNPALQGLATDNHFIPSVHLENDKGASLLAFMASHTGVKATFTPGTASLVQGDVMASFSSRGGPGQSLGVSKPDVTAPGVQILAGHTPNPATVTGGLPGQLFQAIQGTSMSSPHVAGAAALLADLYPGWTPGQIKSALMTSARASDLVKEDGVTPFTPFDAGSGRIDLRKAWDPGLTFDETGANYVALQSQLWNSNYPSLYMPVMPGLITVQRTAKEVTGFDSHYVSRVEYQAGQPRDFRVIAPRELLVHANGTITFDITVDARDVPIGQVRHAVVIFREKNFGCVVRFPVTIVRRQPVVTMDKTCAPGTFANGSTANCSITLVNNTFAPANVSMVDNLPRQLALVPGSVVGGDNANSVAFNGTLAGAQPPNVAIAAGASPFGFVPLAGFGIAPLIGIGDETIANLGLPAAYAFRYGGTLYTSVAIDSNGYAVVGSATAADNLFNNPSPLPNATRPNNTLAAFWTDLNPAAGGALRAGLLTAGPNRFTVLEWAAVPNFTNSAQVNSFQIWIPAATNAGPASQTNITYAYGAVTGGDAGVLTVGAENQFGSRGGTLYFNGTGTAPTAGGGAIVTSAAGAPGETRTITFQVKGVRVGKWVNYAEMTGDLWFGTNIARFAGEVVP